MNIMQNIVNAVLRRNPNIQNNPQAQEYLNVISSGDSQKGQQIAENLCKTYGVTKEQAIAQAKEFFKMK